MDAEIIAIGDELTSGQRLDTNSAWISEKLGELGIRVRFHTTVGDDLDTCSTVFRSAIERVDVIVATGGLGPTADDLTRYALAEVISRDLVRDDDVLEHIRQLLASRGRQMSEQNEAQALFPRGSRVIPNSHGTAPGMHVEHPRSGRTPALLFALPGVPAEMREMWNESVAPMLANLRGSPRVIRHRRLKCFGVGESDLEQMLPDLIQRGRVPTVGITVHKATITLRITSAGESDQACAAAMEPTVTLIRDCLGDLVFGEEKDELHDVVARLLRDRGETLSTVECVTGATISQWLRKTPESAHSYRGGYVVSSPEWMGLFSAMDVVRLPLSEPQTAEITKAMAVRVRDRLGTDYALATGPLADQELSDRPPRFHIALATATGVLHKSHVFAGHPEILTELSAKHALNFLRIHLLAETARTPGRSTP